LEAILRYPDGELIEAIESGLTEVPELVSWSDLSNESKDEICSALGEDSSEDVFFESLNTFIISSIDDAFSSDSGTYTWQQLGNI
jgi:hypothetical protein